MNHNPYNFKEGDTAILDEEIEVKIIWLTKNELIVKVSHEGEEWVTMTYRLTPIKRERRE